MKKAFVTGAAGFIGSHLSEELVKKGYKVKALVHYSSHENYGNLEDLPQDILNEIEIIKGDIQDPFMMNTAVRGSDVVFHLAALIAIPYSYIAPVSYVRTNVEGTLNLMEASLKNNVNKVVHTSTSECYGTAKYVPIDENHSLQGQSPYSASKIAADKIAESYNLSFDLPVATIRPFNTYGPRQSARAIIPTVISQALSNSLLKLGSLMPRRDFTFVKDTVSGFITIAESDMSVGETINIGTNNDISIGELVDTIQKIMGISLNVETEENRIRPKKSEVDILNADNKKAKDLIGWEPTYSLKDGLSCTIEWIKQNIGEFKTDKYIV